MIIDQLTDFVLNVLEEIDEKLVIIDYGIGVTYSYVVVEGDYGRSIGLAVVLLEDLAGTRHDRARKPSIDVLPNLVSSFNPLEKSLGVALLNALSQYLLWNRRLLLGANITNKDIIENIISKAPEPIVVIGNMIPLVRKLVSQGLKEIYVFERNPSIRCGDALPDILLPRIIGKAKTLIVTGAVLVNDTLDYIVEKTPKDAEIFLVGPTAGAHPAAIFAYTPVKGVASMHCFDIENVVESIRLGGGRWDYCKYCMDYAAFK